jgi:hypothetical protein
MNWFSEPQDSIEAAQNLYEFSIFKPAVGRLWAGRICFGFHGLF